MFSRHHTRAPFVLSVLSLVLLPVPSPPIPSHPLAFPSLSLSVSLSLSCTPCAVGYCPCPYLSPVRSALSCSAQDLSSTLSGLPLAPHPLGAYRTSQPTELHVIGLVSIWGELPEP